MPVLRPIGEVTENLDALRKPVKASERQPGPYPYYGAQGVVDHVSGYLFDGEFVLVAEDGENLRSRKEPIALIARGKFWVNNHAHILRGDGEADTRYLYYTINAADISGYVTGSTIPKLSQGSLNRLRVPCPKLEDQRSIASILGALDDKIDLNRRMNETLEATAQAIFEDWFVDFGPTRAKLEGRSPYLAREIWALFPDRLDNENRPEGWPNRPLSTLFSIIGGGTPKTSIESYWEGNIPWFSVTDTPLRGSVFVISTEKKITQAGVDSSSARVVPVGATIISARGTVGNLAIAGRPMAFNQSCYALTALEPAGDYFIYLIVQNMVGRLQSMAHGSVFSTITRQTFEAISQTIPDARLLNLFEHTVRPMFERIKANVFEIANLCATRDLLLPKLMSGEIRVRDAEKIAEPAL